MKKKSVPLLAAVSVLAAVAVLASSARAQPYVDVPDGSPRQPGDMHYSYAVGGVGEKARVEMQGLATSHNLLIKFAQADGAYLIPESIAIRKGSVNVLRLSDAGPLLYVNLPPGVYTVVATYRGTVLSKAFSAVGGRLPDIVLS